MANYGTMQSDLTLLGMANLLATDFGALLNLCQREEVEAWPWSFLRSNFVLNSVPVYSTGTINLPQNSTAVTGNGTAFAATSGTQAQLHVGSSNVALPIASINSGTSLTLTYPWTGAAISAGSYNIITPVYSIVGFIEIYTVKQIVELSKVSREYLNELDPARLATGGNPSIAWAEAGWDSAGNPQIEIWEPPSNILPYIIEGKLAASTMVNTTDLPQIPSAVLENKAMSRACDAIYASSGDAKWFQLGQKYWQMYMNELDKAKTADTQRQNQRKMMGAPPRPGLDVVSTHDLAIVRG